ncbi:M12 family metallopeptidase [Dactylosporangium sp. NPDC051541]|uniref:M12 family metallopeptidase n=1 Tax=Dactylosporangium sp. NPDC051541 TaxID=3363977 RepID=UPI0037A073DB
MDNDVDYAPLYCALPPQPPPVVPAGLDADRADALIVGGAMWVNGTVLHYYFFDQDTDESALTLPDGSTTVTSWVGKPEQLDAVRAAFTAWKDLGIGVEFKEVTDRSEAEIRIGFQQRAGSWSAVGRGVLSYGVNQRTTNYGWDLTTPHGRSTALHELGHVLGMPHEHQSPLSGIEWDEPRVYEYFAGPPNSWDRVKTFNNVIRKLDPAQVHGSVWDGLSIMEYAFPPGLIVQPEQYRDGLVPPGTISVLDTEFVRQWYPRIGPAAPPTLVPFESAALNLDPGQQADFELTPPASRDYQIGVFGAADTVVVLFEDIAGDLRQVAGDDDGGQDRNARIAVKLFQGRRYIVRVRLYSAWASGTVALMYW